MIKEFDKLRNPMYEKDMLGYAQETEMLYILRSLCETHGYGRISQVVTGMYEHFHNQKYEIV